MQWVWTTVNNMYAAWLRQYEWLFHGPWRIKRKRWVSELTVFCSELWSQEGHFRLGKQAGFSDKLKTKTAVHFEMEGELSWIQRLYVCPHVFWFHAPENKLQWPAHMLAMQQPEQCHEVVFQLCNGNYKHRMTWGKAQADRVCMDGKSLYNLHNALVFCPPTWLQGCRRRGDPDIIRFKWSQELGGSGS